MLLYNQRCRSVFNIGGGGGGGYNSAFLPFFRDFEILGGYSGFADIQVLPIFRFCEYSLNSPFAK